jgi:predicted amidohydrolase
MHHKTLLPTYDVFDEDRYFQPGTRVAPLEFKGLRLGITICEGSGTIETSGPHGCSRDPVCELADQGADLLINISSSPFNLGKGDVRREMIGRRP